jgi:hypothetical protein
LKRNETVHAHFWRTSSNYGFSLKALESQQTYRRKAKLNPAAENIQQNALTKFHNLKESQSQGHLPELTGGEE